MNRDNECVTSKRKQKILRAKYRKLTRRYKRELYEGIIYAHRVFELVRQGLNISEGRLSEIGLIDSNLIVQRKEGHRTIEVFYRPAYVELPNPRIYEEDEISTELG